ncbi:MAG: hypothetical protein LH645_11420 [Actinomycetia bacterium]|nr:hypothetical protein [Actinomycetes bacterium]
MGDAEDEFRTSADYDNCTLDAGYDVYWDDFGGPNAMHQMVEAEAPIPDVSPAKLVKTDEWATFLAFEQEVLRADYDCRIDKYVEVVARIDEPLTEFEQASADEIASISAGWEGIVAEAERLGMQSP